RGVRLDTRDPLAQATWLVVAAVDDSGRDAPVQLAASLDDDDLAAILAERRETIEEVAWDAETGAVVARRRERVGAIVLADHPLRDIDPERIRAALLDGVRMVGIAALPWPDAALGLRSRLMFLHAHDAAWPDVSDAALHGRLDEWLAPFAGTARRLEQLRGIDWQAALLSLVPWELQRQFDVL